MRVYSVGLLLFLLTALSMSGQLNVTTFGVQLKPLFSNNFVGAGAEEAESGKIRSRITPASGLNFGMIVRRGISKAWSLETGICFVRRNYKLETYNGELNQPLVTDYRLICYEIPLQAMIFVKLDDKLYMNGSGGVSLDLYPSDVETFASDNVDSVFFDLQHRTFRRSWLQTAMLINYGFEYRTAKSGYFYLGASYHRNFKNIATSVVRHMRNSDPEQLYLPTSGNYLTIDFRYFFHEKPLTTPSRK